MIRLCRLVLVVAVFSGALARGDEPPPMPLGVQAAGNRVHIENWWGLVVTGDASGISLKGLAEANGAEPLGSTPPDDLTLDRLPNTPRPTVFPSDRDAPLSGHEVRIRRVRVGEGATLDVIETCGVRIVLAGEGDVADAATASEFGTVDLLILALTEGGSAEQAAELWGVLRPRLTVPLLGEGAGERDADDRVDAFVALLPETIRVERPGVETVAVSRAGRDGETPPRLVVLETERWEPSPELASLFERKTASWNRQRDAYAGLTPAQMNHRPSNGTHTVRWNIEHLVGRELIFFSSVYSRLDPEIVPIDLNPEQMPPDYVPAHPEWSGDEEVRQVERTHALTRRFAYLLRDVPPDELPSGAPRFVGSLRGLFELMERHYAEHTAHVREKFKLPDWPEG